MSKEGPSGRLVKNVLPDRRGANDALIAGSTEPASIINGMFSDKDEFVHFYGCFLLIRFRTDLIFQIWTDNFYK